MDLCEFLSGGPSSFKILTVESSVYLPKLRELFPNGDLFAITKYSEVANYEPYKKLNIHFEISENVKIIQEKYFDIILGESLLTYAKNSYDELMAVSQALKDTGFFLGSFLNVRYAPILNELREGRFPFRNEKPYAKDEIVKMLNDAVFKEISFLPMEQNFQLDDMVSLFVKAGFENYNRDLSTKSWMFKASRSTAEVVALKELYTKEIRKELSRLLHRIEFGVNRNENLSALWNFIERERIFPDYLLGFIEEVSFDKRALRQILLLSAKKAGLEYFVSEIGERI
ncbi:MAG: methyltransferase [Selenomonadaceae bacterium]|nr:methyltransferase [Selenomonadaceae bacterium]